MSAPAGARLRNRLPELFGVADPLIRDVAAGAALAFVLRIAGSALGFAVNVLLARLLGASGAGVYYLALTVSTVSTVVGRLGMDNALLRFTAAAAARHDSEGMAGVYRRGVGISGLVSIGVALLVALAAPLISSAIFREPALTGPLRIMSTSIPLVTLVFLHSELLKGLGRIRDSMIVYSIGIPAAQIPLLLLLAPRLGPAGAAAGYALAAGAVLLAGRFLWSRATPFLRGLRGEFDTRLLLRTSLPLFWVASLYWLMGWTDTVMLGIWTDSAQVGVYNVAFRTAAMTKLILVSVNSVIAPRFAAFHQAGDYAMLEKLARRTTRGIALVAIPLLLFFVLFPALVLSLFGAEFVAGSGALRLLAAGQFVAAATGSVGSILMMSGNERSLGKNVLLAAVVNVLANAALIPFFGILGAALATSVAIVIQNLGAYYLVWKRLRVRIW